VRSLEALREPNVRDFVRVSAGDGERDDERSVVGDFDIVRDADSVAEKDDERSNVGEPDADRDVLTDCVTAPVGEAVRVDDDVELALVDLEAEALVDDEGFGDAEADPDTV